MGKPAGSGVLLLRQARPHFPSGKLVQRAMLVSGGLIGVLLNKRRSRICSPLMRVSHR